MATSAQQRVDGRSRFTAEPCVALCTRTLPLCYREAVLFTPAPLTPSERSPSVSENGEKRMKSHSHDFYVTNIQFPPPHVSPLHAKFIIHAKFMSEAETRWVCSQLFFCLRLEASCVGPGSNFSSSCCSDVTISLPQNEVAVGRLPLTDASRAPQLQVPQPSRCPLRIFRNGSSKTNLTHTAKSHGSPL